MPAAKSVLGNPTRPLAFLHAALLVVACSSNPPSPSDATFQLIEGVSFGRLSISEMDYGSGMSDSLGFPTARASRTFALAFDHPGNSPVYMKVHRKGRPVKVCDEARYGNLREWRPKTHGPDRGLIPFPDAGPSPGGQTHPEAAEPDLRSRPKVHDLECVIELDRAAGETFEVTLHESEEAISRYRLEQWHGD